MTSSTTVAGLRADGQPKAVALVLAAAGAFLAVLACTVLAEQVSLGGTAALLFAAPFGASAVLVFGGSASPLARPRNVIGGYLVCALSALFARAVLGAWPALAAATCIAIALLAMELTGTVHPPAGGFALVPLVGTVSARGVADWALVTAALGGAIVVVVAGLLTARVPLPHAGGGR